MAHPLQKPCPIIKWNYIWGFTVKAENGQHWNFRLKELPSTRTLIREKIWKNTPAALTAHLTTNDKFILITFPKGKTKVLPLHDKGGFYKTHHTQVESIERENKHAEAKKNFHELLKQLGITFNIDFHRYREDADYMTVSLHGEEIFSGTTEDLQNHKSTTRKSDESN